MRLRTKMSLFGVGIVYLLASLVAYIYDIYPLQFGLAIPWSLAISMLGFLLIHMGTGYFQFAFLCGSIINLLVWGRYMMVTAAEFPVDDE